MNFDEYQEQAATYRMASADHWYALLNLAGEVGELHSLVAKGIRDGYKEDYLTNFEKEMGDILWCLSAIADDHNTNLSDIAQKNLDKLESRVVRGTLSGSGDNR